METKVDTRSKKVRRDLFNHAIYQTGVGEIVAKAFEEVDRWEFIPRGHKRFAYDPEAIIQLTDGSSISQSTLVATMIDLLEPNGSERVLEVGTASGYSAALLSRCFTNVFTTELNPKLAN